jgi:hypothetical protein
VLRRRIRTSNHSHAPSPSQLFVSLPPFYRSRIINVCTTISQYQDNNGSAPFNVVSLLIRNGSTTYWWKVLVLPIVVIEAVPLESYPQFEHHFGPLHCRPIQNALSCKNPHSGSGRPSVSKKDEFQPYGYRKATHSRPLYEITSIFSFNRKQLANRDSLRCLPEPSGRSLLAKFARTDRIPFGRLSYPSRARSLRTAALVASIVAGRSIKLSTIYPACFLASLAFHLPALPIFNASKCLEAARSSTTSA